MPRLQAWEEYDDSTGNRYVPSLRPPSRPAVLSTTAPTVASVPCSGVPRSPRGSPSRRRRRASTNEARQDNTHQNLLGCFTSTRCRAIFSFVGRFFSVQNQVARPRAPTTATRAPQIWDEWRRAWLLSSNTSARTTASRDARRPEIDGRTAMADAPSETAQPAPV